MSKASVHGLAASRRILRSDDHERSVSDEDQRSAYLRQLLGHKLPEDAKRRDKSLRLSSAQQRASARLLN